MPNFLQVTLMFACDFVYVNWDIIPSAVPVTCGC